MARETVINTWCDSHIARDENAHVPGEQLELSLNGTGPLTLDLCPECFATLVEPLHTLLTSHGQSVEKQVKKRTRRASAPAPVKTPAPAKVKAAAAVQTKSQVDAAVPKASSQNRKRTQSKPPVAAEVRAWAVEQGMDVPAKGRIPVLVSEAYQARGSKAKVESPKAEKVEEAEKVNA